MDTQTVSVRLPSELVRRLDEVAQRDRRSRSQWIAIALERALPEPIDGSVQTITPETTARVMRAAAERERREVEPRFKR